MEANTQTKEVQGYFGKPTQITRDDFIRRWSSHMNDIISLAITNDEYIELQQMRNRIRELAGNKFDVMK